MSMLTPPGMGGKYRIKGDRYPRMRRPRGRRRLVLGTVAGLAAAGLLGWGTLQLVDVFSGDGTPASASDSDSRACATPAAAKNGAPSSASPPLKGATAPKPKSITVNVLNATERSGLAQSTADELEKRGFKVGKVGNAPASLDKKVKAEGVLLAAPGAENTTRLEVLGTQLEGADTKYDDRDGDEVDLVLGDGFKKLTPQKDAKDALAALSGTGPAASASPRC